MYKDIKNNKYLIKVINLKNIHLNKQANNLFSKFCSFKIIKKFLYLKYIQYVFLSVIFL